MTRYEKYKDSGIEWIGEIPEHWETERIDWTSEIIRGNTGFKKDELLEDGDYVALQYGKIYKVNKVDSSYNFFVNSEFYKSNQVIQFGDVILISTSEVLEDLGHSCLYSREDLGLLGGEQIALNPKKSSIKGKYLYYFSKVFCPQLRKYARGIKVFRFNIDDLKTIYTLIPSAEEQTQIANYLDRKITEIDQLITDKKALVELYKEEKTAIINHAVTKGINPDAKMKDSGIEWLGEIPEHWGIKKLGYCCYVVRGGSPRPTGDPRYFMGDFIHWITVKEVTNAKGKFITSTAEYLTVEGSKRSRIIEPNTLLLSNSGATLGVPKITLIKGCINDGSVAFPVIKDFLKQLYLYYFFETHTEIYREQMKGNGQPNLNTEIIKNTKLPIPPVKEQSMIVNYIEYESKKIDAKIFNAIKYITLLTEYRTALISEVVTGKIKITE